MISNPAGRPPLLKLRQEELHLAIYMSPLEKVFSLKV